MFIFACGLHNSECGPSQGEVDHVIDGDTVRLRSGEHVRYLLVDTPELSPAAQCFSHEARELNAALVEGREVTLKYESQCTDTYQRLLAFISVRDRDVNATLVGRGFARTLFIPPNGETRKREFEVLEREAQTELRGMWGSCR
jgi:micrococcal nuclease